MKMKQQIKNLLSSTSTFIIKSMLINNSMKMITRD